MNGQLVILSELLTEFLIPLEGKTLEVVIREKRKLRSSKQNSYGYGVALKMLSDYTGFTVGELKEAAKKELGLTKKLRKKDGKILEITRSSSTFSTVEFEEYMKLIRRWGDEVGIFIPEPNQGEISPMDQ